MNTWAQVDKFSDGDDVNAETLNTPIDQLASRTEYLKKRLGTIMDEGFQSALVLNDVPLAKDEQADMRVGNVVYRARDGFRRAQAKMHLYDSFTADESAFTLGILIASAGTTGDVLIYGKLDLWGGTFSKSGMLQEGEEFRTGRYYLSATEPGRITANPGGPLVYVGSFHAEGTHDGFGNDDVAYVNPQFLDIGTSHVHRAYPLVARPAGYVEDGVVVGHLPDGAVVPDSSSSSPSGPLKYPTLTFGGTWTSTDDVTYEFSLVGSEWGSVELHWTKNGSSSYSQVDIPAPGVFVDLDNGLKVKVSFPEATASAAYVAGSLSDAERTWTLKFPYAGRGWVNHSVDAVARAEAAGAGSGSDDGTVTPEVRALVSGAWYGRSRSVYCAFPARADVVEFGGISVGDTVEIGTTVYEFVSGGSAAGGHVAVDKAATTEESLYNLAAVANEAYEGIYKVLVSGDSLTVCMLASGSDTSDSSGTTYTGDSFDVVGGEIPLMVVYDEYFSLKGLVADKPTYVPVELGDVTVTVYAEGASSTNECMCQVGTVLRADVYDDAPDAVYDYVMGLHQEVDYYFPPIPAQNAGLFVNGVEMENAALFPDNPTYLVGHRTIHWMEDDEGHLPWPDGVKAHDDVVDPADDKTIAFYFSVGFQCATGPVTSIVPAPGSQIKLYTYGTKDEAYTGDLMIDAALDFSVRDSGVKGYNVAKQGRGGQLLAGPVVERVKAGNGIIVTQAAGCPDGQGTVTIGLDDGTMRNHFNEVALENAKQEKLGLFPYISLLGWGASNNIPSAFTMMMRVPSNLDPDASYRLQLRMVMFGTVGYSESQRRVAGLQLEYNILPDYTGDTHRSLKTGLLSPSAPRRFSVPLGHNTGSGWEYVSYDPFVASTAITAGDAVDDVKVPFALSLPLPSAEELPGATLKPGYLVAVRISRAAPPDAGAGSNYTAYTSPLGFLSMEWSLEEA